MQISYFTCWREKILRYFWGKQKVYYYLSVNTLHDNGRQYFILQAKLLLILVGMLLAYVL